VQQHVLDNGVGSLAVLDNLGEVVLQQAGQFVDFFAKLFRKSGLLQEVIKFIRQLNGQRREIVDEIERVLDLVCDARCELAERSELFGLDEPVPRGCEYPLENPSVAVLEKLAAALQSPIPEFFLILSRGEPAPGPRPFKGGRKRSSLASCELSGGCPFGPDRGS